MSVKYHINQNSGRANICRATVQACPVGGEHFDNKVEAKVYIEKKLEGEHGAVKTLKKSSSNSPMSKTQSTQAAKITLDEQKIKIERKAKAENLSGALKGSKFKSINKNNIEELKKYMNSEGERYSEDEKENVVKLFSVSAQEAIKIKSNKNDPKYKNYNDRDALYEKLSGDLSRYMRGLPADKPTIDERLAVNRDAVFAAYDGMSKIQKNNFNQAKTEELSSLNRVSRFRNLSHESVEKLVAYMDGESGRYSEEEKNDAVKLFRMTSSEAIGSGMENSRKRDALRERFNNDIRAYRSGKDLATKARADEKLASEAAQRLNNENIATIERNKAAGDTVISYGALGKGFTKAIKSIFRRK